MNDVDALDDFKDEEKLVLFSKRSIIIMIIFLPAIFGGILYCMNLAASNQKKKIFGTLIAISICDFFISFPLFGFEIGYVLFNPFSFLSSSLLALLIGFPFWKKHFEHIDYKEKTPWIHIISFLILLVTINFYHYQISLHYSPYNPPPLYIPKINSYTFFILITFAVFGKFLLLPFKKRKRKTDSEKE